MKTPSAGWFWVPYLVAMGYFAVRLYQWAFP